MTASNSAPLRRAVFRTSSPNDYAPVFAPTRLTPHRGLINGERLVHIVDIGSVDDPVAAAAEIAGMRTVLFVPLRKDKVLLGQIVSARAEIRPFSENEIALLENFAQQAVIAIENARLLNELREALQQQTATADVLKAISRFTFDLQTVLDTLVESAARLCRAERSEIQLLKDGLLQYVAGCRALTEHQERMQREPIKLGRGTLSGRVVLDRKSVQIVDALLDPSPETVQRARSANARTALGVPLLREGTPIGVLILLRIIVQPFTDQEIALAETFADQAVIAIENVRLLNELRESLEQQTATAEVLRVISGSPGDLEPVFNVMLNNAMRICEAKFATLALYEDDAFRIAAFCDLPQTFAEASRRNPIIRPPPTDPLGRVARTLQVVHVADLRTEPDYLAGFPPIVELVEVGGVRTVLVVPMLKDGRLTGAILVYRQEVRPFGDRQIELLKNFAAQAVIAIENTRLLNELRQRTTDLAELLEQQTATSEVLQAISSSPGDLQPVFASMLENAVRICDAKFGNIYRWDGDALHLAAAHNIPPAFAEFRGRFPLRPNPKLAMGRMVATKAAVHVVDNAAEQAYIEREPSIVAAVELGGVRTYVAVPMLKGNELIGAVTVYRQEVRPFTDKQIELVQNFAA